MTTGESIWDKVDYGLVTTPSSAASSDTPKDAEFEANRRFWRKARPCLDVVASLLWLYGALKVFIVDIDQKLLGSVADYRFFAFLVGLVILLAVFRKPSRILGAILYLVFFPIVVLCWKLPRAVYRSKSWVTAFAVMNVFSAVFSHLRYTVLYVAVGAFATLFILVGSSRVVLAIGATAVAALLLTSIARERRGTPCDRHGFCRCSSEPSSTR